MKNTNACNINHEEKTITITKAFAKAAAIYNSTEYTVIKNLRTDFADYTIKQKEITKNSTKKTYAKLTYEKMAEYIVFIEGKETTTLKEFDTIKKMAQFKASPYACVKKWFLAKYPNFASDAELTEVA